MSAAVSRRDLFTRLLRPFQPAGSKPAAANSVCASESSETLARVVVIHGRRCLAHSTFCTVCAERCPVPGAIELRQGRPMVMPEACTGCGVCQEVCPAPGNAILLMPRRPAVKLSTAPTS